MTLLTAHTTPHLGIGCAGTDIADPESRGESETGRADVAPPPGRDPLSDYFSNDLIARTIRDGGGDPRVNMEMSEFAKTLMNDHVSAQGSIRNMEPPPGRDPLGDYSSSEFISRTIQDGGGVPRRNMEMSEFAKIMMNEQPIEGPGQETGRVNVQLPPPGRDPLSDYFGNNFIARTLRDGGVDPCAKMEMSGFAETLMRDQPRGEEENILKPLQESGTKNMDLPPGRDPLSDYFGNGFIARTIKDGSGDPRVNIQMSELAESLMKDQPGRGSSEPAQQSGRNNVESPPGREPLGEDFGDDFFDRIIQGDYVDPPAKLEMPVFSKNDHPREGSEHISESAQERGRNKVELPPGSDPFGHYLSIDFIARTIKNASGDPHANTKMSGVANSIMSNKAQEASENPLEQAVCSGKESKDCRVNTKKRPNSSLETGGADAKSSDSLPASLEQQKSVRPRLDPEPQKEYQTVIGESPLAPHSGGNASPREASQEHLPEATSKDEKALAISLNLGRKGKAPPCQKSKNTSTSTRQARRPSRQTRRPSRQARKPSRQARRPSTYATEELCAPEGTILDGKRCVIRVSYAPLRHWLGESYVHERIHDDYASVVAVHRPKHLLPRASR